jgi:hypothetical protein
MFKPQSNRHLCDVLRDTLTRDSFFSGSKKLNLYFLQDHLGFYFTLEFLRFLKIFFKLIL